MAKQFKMDFRIVFWNIWLDNQLKGSSHPRAQVLLAELDEIIEAQNPDCIGLNEALRGINADEAFVLTHLKKRGYTYTYFALASPFTDNWHIGSAIASKLPLKNIEEIELGDDSLATVRGYKGHKVNAIGAEVQLSTKTSVQVIVSHLIVPKPHATREHWRHQKALRLAIQKPRYQNVIIGGDFNEFRHMPLNFANREKDRLHHKTGTYKNATWRYNAMQKMPFRTNLDKIFWTKDSPIVLQDFEVLKTRISDHSPVMGSFKIGG